MNRELKLRKIHTSFHENNPDNRSGSIYDGVSLIFKYRIQSTAGADKGTNSLPFIHSTNSIWQTY